MKVLVIFTFLMTSLSAFAADESNKCAAAINKVANAGIAFGHASEKSLFRKPGSSKDELASIELNFSLRLEDLKNAQLEAWTVCKDAQ